MPLDVQGKDRPADGADGGKSLSHLLPAHAELAPCHIGELVEPLDARHAAALEQGDPVIDERLAPGAAPDDVREAASGRGETVIVVGHQPDCGEAVLALSEREVSFPPAGYHELEL